VKPIISPQDYWKSIRDMSEDKLREKIIYDIKKYSINFIEGSFDSLIDLLKVGIYVNCIRFATLEEGREFLTKILNCFNIKNLNIDDTLERIKIDSTFHPIRISEWNGSEREVITDTHEKISIKCYSAEFKDIDNWKRELSPYTYDIICHENQILCHTINPDLRCEPDHYIMKNKKIYGLSFTAPYGSGWHSGRLVIHDKFDTIHNDICVTLDTLDEIKNKYESDRKFDETEDIEIDEHYYKGVFYKEDLFNILRKAPYEVNVIGFDGDYIKIDVTDLFVHYTGYILLDIENKKIIEAKKYE